MGCLHRLNYKLLNWSRRTVGGTLAVLPAAVTEFRASAPRDDVDKFERIRIVNPSSNHSSNTDCRVRWPERLRTSFERAYVTGSQNGDADGRDSSRCFAWSLPVVGVCRRKSVSRAVVAAVLAGGRSAAAIAVVPAVPSSASRRVVRAASGRRLNRCGGGRVVLFIPRGKAARRPRAIVSRACPRPPHPRVHRRCDHSQS